MNNWRTKEFWQDLGGVMLYNVWMGCTLFAVGFGVRDALAQDPPPSVPPEAAPGLVGYLLSLSLPHVLGLLSMGIAAVWGLYKTKLGTSVRAALKWPLVQAMYDRLIRYCELKAVHFEATHVPRLKAKLAEAGKDGKFTDEEKKELRVLFLTSVKEEFPLMPLLKFLAGWSDDDLALQVAQLQDAAALKVSTATALKEAAKAGVLPNPR